MKNDNSRTKKIIEEAKKKGLIKNYSDYAESKNGKQESMVKEEEEYYMELEERKKMKKYNIGDIVFVSKYKYKNGENGTRHSFVIIDDSNAVEIDYFGFLISSQLNKSKYKYNHILKKNSVN